jgi:hypothetical protein
MACGSYTLSGIALGCLDNTGGIKTISVASYPTTGFTSDLNASGEITGFTGIASGDWKTFDFRKQSSGLSTEVAVSDVEGTVLFTSSLSLKFSKMETAKRTEIMALILGNAVVKVTDQNGKVWFLGYDNPVTATAATAATGTAFTDGNSYAITLTDLSKELPRQVV